MAEHAPGEPVTKHQLAVSNIIRIEGLVRVMMREGLVSRQEILEEVRAVKFEMGQRPQGEALSGRGFELSREENHGQMCDTNSTGSASLNWLRDVYEVPHRRFDSNGTDRPGHRSPCSSTLPHGNKKKGHSARYRWLEVAQDLIFCPSG